MEHSKRKREDLPEPEEAPEKGPTIVMPEERRSFITIKLREYETRLETLQARYPYKAPFDSVFAGTHYKIALAKALLKDGRVNTHALQREIEKDLGFQVIGPRYENACTVIDDYCKTGGEHNCPADPRLKCLN